MVNLNKENIVVGDEVFLDKNSSKLKVLWAGDIYCKVLGDVEFTVMVNRLSKTCKNNFWIELEGLFEGYKSMLLLEALSELSDKCMEVFADIEKDKPASHIPHDKFAKVKTFLRFMMTIDDVNMIHTVLLFLRGAADVKGVDVEFKALQERLKFLLNEK